MKKKVDEDEEEEYVLLRSSQLFFFLLLFRCEYLVLGGQIGMLMIKNLVTGYSKICRLGRGMINSVCLSQEERNKKLRVTVCNNDQSVFIITVPEMEKIQTLNMPSAINCCMNRC
jgi:hypothetical protein